MMNPLSVFVALVLSCSGVRAAGPTVNFTCPEHCTCDAATLSCHDLSQLPSLEDIPVQFTSFFFYDCLLQRLARLPAAYGKATDLLVINSQLDAVEDDAFQVLDRLETLELRGNRLRDIPRAVLGPLKGSLTKLDLAENKFVQLPNWLFADLGRLSELRLDGNSMEFDEQSFEGANNLTKFTCNNCRLRTVPAKSLGRIKNLRHLELNQNQLQRLDEDAFGDLGDDGGRQLLHLSLDNCSLESVDKTALRPFSALQQLNLGHNRLKYVSVGSFKHFRNSLAVLYMENNQLTVVDEQLAPWSALNDLKLGHNPWTCDCNMAWIKNIDLDNIDHENITCSSPSGLVGHQLHSEMAKMKCPDRRYLLVVGFGIPVLTVALVVTICCVVKLATKSRRRRGDSIQYQPVRDSNSSKQSLVVE